MDLWLAPAGIRGGPYWRRVHVPRRQPPSHPLCLRCSPGFSFSYRFLVSSVRHCSVPFPPLGHAGERTALSTPLSRRGAAALSTPSGVAAPFLPVVAGAGPYGLSGPVALGPGIRALVSGQGGSPLFLPWTVCLSCSPTSRCVWRARSKGSRTS